MSLTWRFNQPLASFFVIAAAAILFVTSAAKLLSSISATPILSTADPVITMMTVRQVYLATATVELLVCLVVLHRNLPMLVKIASLSWLATMFLLYRLGLWHAGYAGSCPCLGNAFAWLHASPATINRTMTAAFYFLLIGSYILFGHEILTRVRTLSKSSVDLEISR